MNETPFFFGASCSDRNLLLHIATNCVSIGKILKIRLIYFCLVLLAYSSAILPWDGNLDMFDMFRVFVQETHQYPVLNLIASDMVAAIPTSPQAPH